MIESKLPIGMDGKLIREKYKALTNTLIERKLTITTMESITSGLLASLITDTEGSSAVLKEAFVTYSNEAKIRRGVAANIIEKYGVYSSETAKAMAEAAALETKADLAIGVTGSSGNVDPANKDSICGQVYFAIKYGSACHTYYLEIQPNQERKDFKMCVAGEIVEELLSLLKNQQR